MWRSGRQNAVTDLGRKRVCANFAGRFHGRQNHQGNRPILLLGAAVVAGLDGAAGVLAMIFTVRRVRGRGAMQKFQARDDF